MLYMTFALNLNFKHNHGIGSFSYITKLITARAKLQNKFSSSNIFKRILTLSH